MTAGFVIKLARTKHQGIKHMASRYTCKCRANSLLSQLHMQVQGELIDNLESGVMNKWQSRLEIPPQIFKSCKVANSKVSQLEKHRQESIVCLFDKTINRNTCLYSNATEKGFWPIVSTVMDGWIVLAMDSVLCLGTLSVNTIEIHYLHH